MYCTVHSSDIYFEKVCVGKPVIKIEQLKCSIVPLLHQHTNKISCDANNELKELVF